MTLRKQNISNYPTFLQSNPNTTNHDQFFSTKDPSTKNRLSIGIVLGSGGHTSEILSLTKNFARGQIHTINYIHANTDEGSKSRAEQQELELNMIYPNSGVKVRYFSIPRAREVGQSYFTSIFTTLWSFWVTLFTTLTLKHHILIVNGPGSCVPVCFVVLLCNIIGISDTSIVFVESLTRVKQLSLSGKILYYFVDRFVVHWPQLQDRYPLAEYLGIIY
jgi:beta-1,4-N-acetylglucosaminyltransferase